MKVGTDFICLREIKLNLTFKILVQGDSYTISLVIWQPTHVFYINF